MTHKKFFLKKSIVDKLEKHQEQSGDSDTFDRNSIVNQLCNKQSRVN